MHFTSILVSSLFVLSTYALPAVDPVEVFKRAGPAAGTVITKCASSGMLALAFDDGPYQVSLLSLCSCLIPDAYKTCLLVHADASKHIERCWCKGNFLHDWDSLRYSIDTWYPTQIHVCLFISRLYLQPEVRHSVCVQLGPSDCLAHVESPFELRIPQCFGSHNPNEEG